MISNYALISVWSYALVSISYLFFLLKIIEGKFEFLKSNAAAGLLVFAIISTILWGIFELLNSFFRGDSTSLITAVFDFARYLFWCLFVIAIICPGNDKTKKLYLFLLLARHEQCR